MATFRNPANGYTQSVTKASAFFWCLIFGVFYFAYKGVWRHAAIGLLAAFLTAGISWLIYPFFAFNCVRTSYLERGWRELGSRGAHSSRSRATGPSFDGLDV